MNGLGLHVTLHGGSDPLVCEGPSAHGVERGAPPAAPGVLRGGHWEAKAPKRRRTKFGRTLEH